MIFYNHFEMMQRLATFQSLPFVSHHINHGLMQLPAHRKYLQAKPLVRSDHCIGTNGSPSDAILDFVVAKWVGGFLEKAPFSLIEICTLGAATESNNLRSGNAKCCFFANMIVIYDGSSLKAEEKSHISEEVHDVIS